MPKRAPEQPALDIASLYRIMSRMLDDRLIREVAAPSDSPNDRRTRRYYSATELGRAIVRAEATRLRALLASPAGVPNDWPNWVKAPVEGSLGVLPSGCESHKVDIARRLTGSDIGAPPPRESPMRSMTLTFGALFALHTAVGASSASAQAPKESPTTGLHACSLLTDADIVRITGRPNPFKTPPERTEMPNGATTCNYVGLDVTLLPRVTPQNFQAMRKTEEAGKDITVETVPGVGDEAYFSVRARRSSSNVGIVVRRGAYQLALGDRMPADSVAWMKPKLVELAKLAITKLR